MNLFLILLTLSCISVQLAIGAPSRASSPPLDSSTPDTSSLESSTTDSLPQESTTQESKKTKDRINAFAKNIGRKPEEVEQLRSALKKHRESNKKKHQQQRDRQAHGEEFKAIREKMVRKNKATKNEVQIPRVSIADVNAASKDLLYDGDIILTADQIQRLSSGEPLKATGEQMPDWWHNIAHRNLKALKKNHTDVEERSKRQAMNPTYYTNSMWPNGYIPFTFASGVTETRKNIIRKVAGVFNDYTCLVLDEKTSLSSTGLVYTTPNTGIGCNSIVGRASKTTSQVVNLEQNGCDSFQTAAHETLHAIGFWHAQSRHDRNDWIIVWWPNIPDDLEDQFNLETPTTNNNFGETYDFGSVMHYGNDAFGIKDSNGKSQQTIWTMPTWSSTEFDNTIGSRATGPSFADLRMINAQYNCQSFCVNSPKTCYRGGFQNPNNCAQCFCPPGVGGDDCKTPSAYPEGYAPSGLANTCTGANIAVSTSGSWTTLSGTIGSSSWNGASNQDLAWCHWYLGTTTGYHLVIEVQSIGGNCGVGCDDGFLDVRLSSTLTSWDWSKTGRHICCPSDLQAQGGSTLVWNTVGPNAYISTYALKGVRSFTLRYKAVPN